jgi:hypothetical protein
MEDDGLGDSPDCQDAYAVAHALREVKAFPATIELSDAEAQQAAISVENLRDYGEEAEIPQDDLEAALGHLREQGLPR